MIMHRFWIVCTFLFSLESLSAQEVLSPEMAIDLALKNNFSILIARNDQLSTEAGVTRGNAGMLPRVDLAAGATGQNININQRYSNGISVATNGVSNNATNASASLGWTLFDGGKMFVIWDRLKEQKALSQVQLRAQIEQQVSDILDAYYLIIRLKQEVKSLKFGLDITEEQLALTKRKQEVGSSSRQEILQVTVDRNTSKSLLLQQDMALTNAQTELNRLMGVSLTTEYQFPEKVNLDYLPQLEEIRKQAMEKNASILLAKGNQSLNQFRLREIKAERSPILKLSTGYNYSRNSSSAGFALFNQSNGLNGGLTLSWNLFNGGQLNSRIKQSQLLLDNDELRIKDAMLLTDASILVAIRQWQQATELLKLELENFESAKENLALALERLKLGNGTILIVKEAQRSYEEAIQRQTTASWQAIEAKVSLLRLSGYLVK